MLAAPVAGGDGKAPEPRFFIVPQSDYRAIDNWYAMGLAGTGSKDVTTDNIFVPEHRTLAAADGKGAPHPGSKVNPGALYRLPWYALFGFVNGATALGIAQGAIDDSRPRCARASPPRPADSSPISATMQLRVAEAATQVDAAETLMLKDCDEAMRIAEAGKLASMDEKTRWRRDAAFAVRMSVKAIDMLLPAPAARRSSIRIRCSARCAMRMRRKAISASIGTRTARCSAASPSGLDPDFPLL